MQTSTLARRAGAANRDVSANVFKKKAKVAAPAKKAAPKRSPSGGGGEALWLPNVERPAWLDGSLPGDRGFDPLGLSKPTEYIQVRRERELVFLPASLRSGVECFSREERLSLFFFLFLEEILSGNFFLTLDLWGKQKTKKNSETNRSASTSSTRTRP